jgi:Transposase IS200 like.
MKPTRIKLPAPAAYHITSRIKNDGFMLEEDADKRDLLDIIRRTADFAGISVMSYTIIDNHFHLLAHIPARQEVDNGELEYRANILWGQEKAKERFDRWRFWEARGKAQLAEKERAALRRRMYDITPFVKTIKELFTHSYNRRHATSGAVWGRSRFKSAAVASDFKTLATVSAYIDLNAVRAKIVRHPKNYKWCGVGAAKKGDTLALAGIADLSRTSGRAQKHDVARKATLDASARQTEGNGRRTENIGCRMEDCEAALAEYLNFLDGTKSSGNEKNNIGGSPIFKLATRFAASSNRAAKATKHAHLSNHAENHAKNHMENHASGYARKTLDSADLTRLGADGVARWLADSDIKPESVAEMWTRRFGNFVIGGIIGPLDAIIGMNDAIYGHNTMRRRWQPGVIEEICTAIHVRNNAARKRNIS